MKQVLQQNLLHQKLAIWKCICFSLPSKRRIGMAHSAITKNNIQQNNKWTIEIPMPPARHGLAAASFGDRYL
jgi:hypothetical protein